MTKKTFRRPRRRMTEIGWREMVGLPEFHIASLRAKIDTGARTSALHAVDLKRFERHGASWVEFHVPLPGQPRSKRSAAPIADERPIKNTSGVAEQRIIVETTLVLAKRHWRIEVSLADRENMEFDLILGRTALRGRRLLVNPGRSSLAGQPAYPAMAEDFPESGGLRTSQRGLYPMPDAATQGNKP